MGMGGQRDVPADLPPGNIPGTHCMGGWVGPRDSLDRCGKSRPNRDSIPGPSSPVVISLYVLNYPGPVSSRFTDGAPAVSLL